MTVRSLVRRNAEVPLIRAAKSYRAALRSRARRISQLPGATVVMVTYNSGHFLPASIAAIRAFSSGVRMIVVDNASSDETVDLIRAFPDIDLVRLPFNAGHGLAMDLGFLLGRTEFLVALDADAFPIAHSWIERLIAPLESGAHVSGVTAERDYAHPCALAMRRDRFITRRHTFEPSADYNARIPTRLDPDWHATIGWDAGELITRLEWPRVHLFGQPEIRGPKGLGHAWHDLVYHNFYGARLSLQTSQDGEATVDGEITIGEARRAWQEATEKYLYGIV